MADDKRFPRWVYGVGTEPDARFSLANERTFLAWIRTSLALLAGGVALEALDLPIEEHLRFSAAIVLVVVGLVAPADRVVRLGAGRACRPARHAAAVAVGVRAAGRGRVRGRAARADRAGDGVTRRRRPRLAAERTHLAWRRTALGLTAGGVAAAHLLQEFVGGAAWMHRGRRRPSSRRRSRQLAPPQRRPGHGASGVDGRLVAVCACGLLLLGVGALAFVLLRGP